MKLKTTIRYLLLFSMMGCIIGKRGIFLHDLPERPMLEVNNNILTIKTSNPVNNTTFQIHKVNISVDHDKKSVKLFANQATGKKHQEIFTIKLEEYKIMDPTSYSFYWLDPDNTATKLDLTVKNNSKE